ncbi:MAG: MATE family efflux transporter [Clostridiales bacterium]|nr:MATE family efflux transporter [Clostridiales bacterium]
MTEGGIAKKILAFAFPLFLGNLFQQLYNTADSLIVGNFLGDQALAAVSSSGNLIFLIVGFFYGLAIGAGVVISHYYGAREIDDVHKAIHTTIAFSILVGFVLMAVGVLLAPKILVWMGTPSDVMPNSLRYFRIYFAGSMALVLYNAFMGIMQAVGDSRHPLLFLMVSSVMNILLDLLFVGVLGFGVGSAAAATIISQFFSAFLCFMHLLRCDEEYRVHPAQIRLDVSFLGQIVRNGLPSGLQNCVISLANVLVQTNINSFGSIAMAGSGSYSKIEGFAFLPVTCFAMAMTTFVSQNLGAGQYGRVKKGSRFGILCCIGLAELIGAAIWLLAPFLIGLFSNDPDVIAVGVTQARIEALFYFLLAFSHVIAGVMRGAGKPNVPMVVMLLVWCVLRITYITLALHFVHVIQLLFWAYPLTWSISSLIFLVYYLRADWMHGRNI